MTETKEEKIDRIGLKLAYISIAFIIIITIVGAVIVALYDKSKKDKEIVYKDHNRR